MTIDEAKNVIIEILRKGNGLTLLELYDEFIRNHGGKLKIENKSFEEILDILFKEYKIVKTTRSYNDDEVYYERVHLNLGVTFYGRPKNCYSCRFGMTDILLKTHNLSNSTLDGSNEEKELYDRLEKGYYVCLLDPEIIVDKSDFSEGKDFNKCPFYKNSLR